MSGKDEPTAGFLGADHSSADFAQHMTQFELGMIVAKNSFEQWVSRCAAAAGMTGYSPLELLVLHLIDYNSRPKRIADICFALKIEDTHLVSYALKKLTKAGFVESSRQGKETFFVNTASGSEIVTSYREVRAKVLEKTFTSIAGQSIDIEQMSNAMRALSSVYEQAARSVEVMDLSAPPSEASNKIK